MDSVQVPLLLEKCRHGCLSLFHLVSYFLFSRTKLSCHNGYFLAKEAAGELHLAMCWDLVIVQYLVCNDVMHGECPFLCHFSID